jgi:hypothetical protein
MRNLNKKNLKELNRSISEFTVLRGFYQDYKDLDYSTKKGRFGSYCFHKSLEIAIRIYKEFGIALISESFMLEDVLPNEKEYEERHQMAKDNYFNFEEKEVA